MMLKKEEEKERHTHTERETSYVPYLRIKPATPLVQRMMVSHPARGNGSYFSDKVKLC